MTLEFSLRRRAQRARYMAVFWLALATLILVGTYISLPFVANRTLSAIHAMEMESRASTVQPTADPKTPHIYAIGVLALSLVTVGFACFLLGRTAFVEIELAARFAAFADALCLAGDNFDQLEKVMTEELRLHSGLLPLLLPPARN
jgi:hypothetical protein